jgi:hypothetical protein
MGAHYAMTDGVLSALAASALPSTLSRTGLSLLGTGDECRSADRIGRVRGGVELVGSTAGDHVDDCRGPARVVAAVVLLRTPALRHQTLAPAG